MGWSYVLVGEPNKAIEAIRRVDLRLSSPPPEWLKQAWGLHKADLLLLLGQLPEALIAAHDALGSGKRLLHSAFFAGPFARWVALSAKGTEDRTSARAQLTQMVEQLHAYDAIDQVEILCAERILQDGLQHNSRILIEAKLTQLPGAVRDQLIRLGMMCYDQVPTMALR